VREPYELFKSKYGGNSSDRAKECTAKVEALLQRSAEILPAAIEKQAIRTDERAIDPRDTDFRYLENVIKRADSVNDLKTAIATIRQGFDPFQTKWGNSDRAEAKKVIEKYSPVLRTAEDLIATVAKDEDMLVRSA